MLTVDKEQVKSILLDYKKSKGPLRRSFQNNATVISQVQSLIDRSQSINAYHLACLVLKHFKVDSNKKSDIAIRKLLNLCFKKDMSASLEDAAYYYKSGRLTEKAFVSSVKSGTFFDISLPLSNSVEYKAGVFSAYSNRITNSMSNRSLELVSLPKPRIKIR